MNELIILVGCVSFELIHSVVNLDTCVFVSVDYEKDATESAE